MSPVLPVLNGTIDCIIRCLSHQYVRSGKGQEHFLFSSKGATLELYLEQYTAGTVPEELHLPPRPGFDGEILVSEQML